MISFPNTLNQGGINNVVYDNKGTRVYPNDDNRGLFDTERLKTLNTDLNSSIKKALLDDRNLDISLNEYRSPTRMFLSAGKTIYGVDDYGAGNTDTVSKKSKGSTDTAGTVFGENPFQIPAPILATMNRYSRVYKTPVKNLMAAGKNTDGGTTTTDESGESTGNGDIEYVGLATQVVSSIFNTTNMIQVVGLQDNLPLMNIKSDAFNGTLCLGSAEAIGWTENNTNTSDENKSDSKSFTETFATDSSGSKIMEKAADNNVYLHTSANPFNTEYINNSANCTIRELVSASRKPNGELGMGKYRYADFLFCKNIGKVSNNHMITLRKFAHPVGDNIFRFSGKGYMNDVIDYYHGYQENSPMATMITWFDTDDNKLEDIMSYGVKASWKKFESRIRDYESKEDQSSGGVIEMFANSFNPAYNSLVARGMAGSQSIWKPLGSKIFGGLLSQNMQNRLNSWGISSADYDGKNQNSMGQWEAMRYGADQHKIYEPQNTIRATHRYDGELTLNHKFTLNFTYRLRALDVMNPKTVMLDLLGNILEMTYRRGQYWAGKNRIIGPPRNSTGIAKANAIIDRTWDKLEGFAMGFANGNIDWSGLMSSLSDMVSSAANKVKGAAEDMANNIGSFADTFLDGAKKLAGKFVSSGASRALLGQLKNKLGRPAVYVMDSLLDGGPVGLWHVTIGNPKNPIAAFGNLIMNDDSKITHSGPLGFDDFPTELKVSITLEHGRSRDLTEIGRMYTKGVGGFYNVLDKSKLTDFFTVSNTTAGKELETNLFKADMARNIQENLDNIDAKIKEKEAQIAQYQNELSSAKNKENEEKVQKSNNSQDTEKKDDKSSSPTPQQGSTQQPQQQSNQQSSSSGQQRSTTDIQKDIDKLKDEIEKLNKSIKPNQDKLKAEVDPNAKEGDPLYKKTYGDLANDPSAIRGKLDESLRMIGADSVRRGPYDHFILTDSALRYETLGQDTDYEGRILIDEVS